MFSVFISMFFAESWRILLLLTALLLKTSGIRHASSCGNSHLQISRRLADSRCVSSPGTSGSEHGSSFMSSVGNCH